MTAAAGRHPTDAERAAAALPVLRDLLAAVEAGDAAAVAALYADDAAWLDRDGIHDGGPAAAARHVALGARAIAWAEPQQRGAKAALRWSGADGASGAVVVEVRRGRVIFAASS
ncbi:MAG: hypothetical protein AB7V42_11990 [Thermoleophilia bacterium]